MERSQRIEQKLEPVIVLPPREHIGEALASLELEPSPRNQLLPQLEILAGQELPASELVRRILEAIVNYASRTTLAHQAARRAAIIKREFGRADNYLAAFITDKEILDQACAALAAALSQPEIAELIEVEAAEIHDDGIEQLLRGAPRRLKQTVRNLSRIPEHQRTQEQSAELEKLLRQLGERGLSITTGRHKIKQPSQRQLAEQQARLNRS